MKIGEFEITNRVGLGTNRLTNAPANVELIREAVAAGVQMIDTAHLYAGGERFFCGVQNCFDEPSADAELYTP